MSKESKKLSAELFRHSELYYNGEPEITDPEFDRMKRRLEELDPDDPFHKQIGAPVTENAREHKIPMCSLANANNPAEFKRWYKSLPKGTALIAQLKLDGSSISGEYQKGKPKHYLTRGEGITGSDVTSNILRCNTPQITDLGTFTGSVRGESVIHRSLFTPKNFPNKDDPTQTESNRRNSVNGAVKKTNSPRVQYVDLVFYDVANGVDFATETEKVKYLKEDLGLPVVKTWAIPSLEQALACYEGILAKREEFPYLIDGVVFKVDDLAIQESMGMSSQKPKGQVAFKFPSLQGKSVLRRVELKVGHTGCITCRAHYDEVTIDKRNFTHANLNNFDYIKKRDICIGDEVIVEIGGDIIPKIIQVSKKGKNRKHILPPEKCPECGTPIVRQGKRHYCLNEDCSGRAIRKVRNWITKTGIKYYGPVAQVQCYEAGVVVTPVDLYTVSQADLGAVIGGGNARNVLKEVQAHKQLSLKIFMGSLGIPFLGRSNALHLIDQGIDTLDKFRNIDTSKSYEGFGDTLKVISETIRVLGPQIEALLAAGVEVIEPSKQKGKAMASGIAGKKIVVTGTLSEGRKVFEGLIEEKGGTFSKAVSGTTDYLLAGENCGGKLAKAAKLGVQVLTEEQFRAMLG